MNTIETGLPGLLLIEPRVFEDDRGYFIESYHKEKYLDAGITQTFVQDNESKSGKGVVRGLHYQLGEFAQAKLVRVVQGSVFDVVVDLRFGSPTFGQWYGIEISEFNKRQLFIPRGFAHGFSVLSETAIFTYKCDNVYSKEAERSINPYDPKLKIDWKVKRSDAVVSVKDEKAPMFDAAEMDFKF